MPISAPQPFHIDMPQATLVDMRTRLANTRFAADVGNADWSYGVEAGWLTDMVRYWHDEFDWRAHEAAMNGLPHFRIELEAIPIHFVHVKGKKSNARPLILTHGWPWTFWDYRHLIGPLTDPEAHGAPDAPAFDLVIPSLPGFGFSAPLTRTGIHIPQIAALWVSLMSDVLGYERLVVGGGDWGSAISLYLGHAYPDRVSAVYSMFSCVPGVAGGESVDLDFAPDEAWMGEHNRAARQYLASHLTVHSLDPQTLAYGLVDSPAGTAAWLWERRRAWSDCNGDVLSVFSRDDLCTQASIYWLTGTIGSSLRIYADRARVVGEEAMLVHQRKPAVEVPTAFAVFPRDNLHLPRRIMEEHTNLKRYTLMPRGGHFGALEQPQLVIDDLRAFIASINV